MSSVTLLPYADFLGIRIAGERNGSPLLVMPFSEGLLNLQGMMHGGAISGLLEIAAIAAIDASIRIRPISGKRLMPYAAANPNSGTAGAR